MLRFDSAACLPKRGNRGTVLLLILLAATTLAKPSPDDALVCPRGCIDEQDLLLSERELCEARAEVERIKNLVRHGGA